MDITVSIPDEQAEIAKDALGGDIKAGLELYAARAVASRSASLAAQAAAKAAHAEVAASFDVDVAELTPQRGPGGPGGRG